MELITYPLLAIACIVWFFSKWSDNRNAADFRRRMDEVDEVSYQREKVYFDALKERADKGDKQAIYELRWFGYDIRAHGWEC